MTDTQRRLAWQVDRVCKSFAAASLKLAIIVSSMYADIRHH
jgi:hypothetical protein